MVLCPAPLRIFLAPIRSAAPVQVEDYMLAAGETIFSALTICWTLTYIFNFDTIKSNRLKDMVGYNNACVGWDFPPSNYVGLFAGVVATLFACRFSLLDI